MLKDLEPGTQYEVRVVAKAHENGEEQEGKPYVFKTAGIGRFCRILWCIICFFFFILKVNPATDVSDFVITNLK